MHLFIFTYLHRPRIGNPRPWRILVRSKKDFSKARQLNRKSINTLFLYFPFHKSFFFVCVLSNTRPWKLRNEKWILSVEILTKSILSLGTSENVFA